MKIDVGACFATELRINGWKISHTPLIHEIIMYHSPKKPGPSEILRSLSRYGLEPKGVGFHSEPFANFLKGYIPAWIKPIQFRNVPCQAGSTGRKWKARKEARK